MHRKCSNCSLLQLSAAVALAFGCSTENGKSAGNPVITTIPVASNVGGIVADPKSHFVYVTEFNSGAIGVINTSTNELSSVINTTAGSPLGLAISRDGTNLYVTLATPSGGMLQQISAKTGEVIFSIPTGTNPQIPAVSSDESVICVPAFDGSVTIFSPDFQGSVTLGGTALQAVFVNDSVVLVTNGTDVIGEIDTATGAVLSTSITLPSKVLTEVLTPDKKTLYAAGQNAVYVVDVATAQVTTTIAVPNPANNTLGIPTLSTDEKFLYVPVLEIGGVPALSTVVVIGIKQGAVVGTPIPVGVAPVQIAVAPTPRGTEGYVSNEISGTVTVIKIK
ncbi:MAG: YncE family protein [Verrucomicrobia bacterium]|nr:YncE family protein [Verrucomicrobiota bacterium]